MTKENPEVRLQKEGKSYHWWKSDYLTRWSGLKRTPSINAIRFIALPATIIAVTVLVLKPTNIIDKRGKPLSAPSISLDLPLVTSKILDRPPESGKRQGNKPEFVRPISIVNLRATTQLPVGLEAKATLVSGATNGIVKAQLAAPLLVDGEPLIPQGATVFGKGQSTEERLFVEFTKAVLLTGETISIRAQAFDDTDKILGLKGSLVANKTKKMLYGAALGFMAGMAEGMEDTSGSNMWGMPQKRSMHDAALSGASKAAMDQSQAAIEEMKNAPYIIEVKAGTEFYLITDELTKKKE